MSTPPGPNAAPTPGQAPSQAPNPPKPWKEYIRKFGLQNLNDRGYINLNVVKPAEHGFGYGSDHGTPGARWRQTRADAQLNPQTPLAVEGVNPQVVGSVNPPTDGGVNSAIRDEHWIHPLFAKKQWRSTEMTDPNNGWWESLKPVWQLATLLLEERLLAGFLIGLLDKDSHVKINHKNAVDKHGNIGHYFEAKRNPTSEEVVGLWKDLYRLADHHHWALKDLKSVNTEGITDATKGQGLTTEGSNTYTLITREYVEILCEGIRVDTTTVQWSPGTDEDSARLRVQLLFASTLVHELMHALWMSKFICSTPEPWYMDERVAEVGWQWEKAAFSGKIWTTTDKTRFAYGLIIERWPGPFAVPGGKTLMGYTEWGRGQAWVTRYAVSMDWVNSLFAHDLWNKVERFGLTALEPKRLLGFRVATPGNEPAVVKGPISPLSPDDAGPDGVVDRPDTFNMSYRGR